MNMPAITDYLSAPFDKYRKKELYFGADTQSDKALGRRGLGSFSADLENQSDNLRRDWRTDGIGYHVADRLRDLRLSRSKAAAQIVDIVVFVPSIQIGLSWVSPMC